MMKKRISLPRTFIFVVILVLLIGSKICPQTFKVELNVVYAEETTIYIVASGKDYYLRPRINNNGEIVWTQSIKIGFPPFYAVWSNLRGQISSGPQDWDPDINDSGEIIWRFGDGLFGENGIWSNVRGLIYSGQRVQDPYYDTHRINNTGEIVWNRAIYLSGRRVEEVWSNTRGRLTYSPEDTYNRELAINDLGEVVYQSYSSAPGRNTYDILSTERGFITNDSSWEWNPDVNNSGEVVWMQEDEEGWEIWSSTSGRITFNDTYDYNPSINNNGEIVWQHWDGSDWEIFSSVRGQITKNDVHDTDPHINDFGEVTWLVGSEEGHAEAVMATDGRPPSVEHTGTNPGPPRSYEVTCQDLESGLGDINVIAAQNFNVDIPPFDVGTKDPVIIIVTKIDQSKSSFFDVEVVDVVYNVTQFTVSSPSLSIDPSQGTVGTEFTIYGRGYGEKRGQVTVGTTKCKVMDWTDTSITCQLKKVSSTTKIGTHDVAIKLKGKGIEPIVMEGAFSIMAPSIQDIEPDSGEVKEEITITGSFFGTKKVKVYMDDGIRKKPKRCKVTSVEMNTTTGESELRVLVPKGLNSGMCDLTVVNKVGSHTDTKSFTID